MKFEAAAPGSISILQDESTGISLSLLLPLKISVRLERRTDSQVRLLSDHSNAEYRLDDEEFPEVSENWMPIFGLTADLQNHGYRLNGFDLKVQSTLPGEAHLEERAALIAATAKVLRAAYELSFTDIEIARIGTRVLGRRSSAALMGAALGRASEVLLVDTKTFEFERTLVPMELVDFAVLTTGLGTEPTTRVDNGSAFRAFAALRERDVFRFGSLLSYANHRSGDARAEIIVTAVKEIPEILGIRLLNNLSTVVLVMKPRTGSEAVDTLIRALHARDPLIGLRKAWP